MRMNYLDGVLTNFAITCIEDIRREQERKGKKATGVSAEKLNFTLINGVQIIDGSGYMYFQEYGRGPGKMPNVDNIQEWIDAKGLDLNAWGVAKNIAKNGTLLFQGKDEPLGLEEIFTANLGFLREQVQKEMFVVVKDTILKNIN